MKTVTNDKNKSLLTISYVTFIIKLYFICLMDLPYLNTLSDASSLHLRIIRFQRCAHELLFKDTVAKINTKITEKDYFLFTCLPLIIIFL